MHVFWRKGFSATTTDELVQAMGLGRQSVYNAYGDKRTLYLQALHSYMLTTLSGHLQRLNTPESSLEGVRQLLVGLAAPDDDTRGMGCMGVNSTSEFGTTDAELVDLRAQVGEALAAALTKRLRAGQKAGEIDASLSVRKTVAFVQMTMNGLQMAARAGTSLQALHDMANFAADRLQARSSHHR